MNLDENAFDVYYTDIATLRDTAIENQRAAQELLEEKITAGDQIAQRLVRFREQMLDGSDREKVYPYLLTGFFGHLELDQRIAAFLVTSELKDAIEYQELQTRFELYREEHALFRNEPTLFSSVREAELVPLSSLPAIESDGIVHLKSGYGRIDPLLSPEVIQSMSAAYPQAPLWIRLDPHQKWQSRPAELLLETILVPANPRWWGSLALHRGSATGGSYRIDPPANPADDLEGYCEYHVKGLRRLETFAQRKKPDHLTFMLEELQMLREGLLIGRCIHLDTAAPRGIAPATAEVLHVDLAINVYEGDSVQQRLSGDLSNGRIVDATCRSHLLRAEQVPFNVAAFLSLLFFKSRHLRRDLFNNQFSL